MLIMTPLFYVMEALFSNSGPSTLTRKKTRVREKVIFTKSCIHNPWTSSEMLFWNKNTFLVNEKPSVIIVVMKVGNQFERTFSKGGLKTCKLCKVGHFKWVASYFKIFTDLC